MLLENKDLMLLKVGGNFLFGNNTLNKCMLNIKQVKIIQNDLYFSLIFFNLVVNSKVYQFRIYKVYSKSIKKRVYIWVNSQNVSRLVNS